jgi:hypothetical protein
MTRTVYVISFIVNVTPLPQIRLKNVGNLLLLSHILYEIQDGVPELFPCTFVAGEAGIN